MSRVEELKNQILEQVKEYYDEKFKTSPFIEGETYINYGGRYFDEHELMNLVDASLDFWLTSGKWVKQFEKDFAKYLGVRYCSLCNSGSSANLLAFMALTSPLLGNRQVQRGDEVITVAAGFPTTISPIIQYGAVPVFVDVELPSYNINIEEMKKALSSKTKAVMIAHSLGNPFDLERVKAFCEEHQLWLIEDNCDALGSEYFIDGTWKKTGTIGHIGTSSFYPPHHMTMGEGGAVYTNHPKLHRIIQSLRDWGRDCWCDSGRDNTCGYRFTKQFGELPVGYDHKYVYSHFGYNLKLTDMQAAIGCAQLEKLTEIVKMRRKNWDYLREHLSELEPYLILPEPTLNSRPSWFGFIMTVKESSGKRRVDLAKYLEENHIQTRNLFAGNILKHPVFHELKQTPDRFRVVGELEKTDMIMNNSLWIGVYPGMTREMLDYMIKTIKDFFLMEQ